MALTKEEISIRLGMDSSALRAGMASSSRFVESSLRSLSNKAVSLLKANLYVAVVDLFRQMIPTAEEFWNGIYGTDEASMSAANQALENIKKLRKEVESAQAALDKQRDDNAFKSVDNRGKEALLESSLFFGAQGLKKADDLVKLMKATRASDLDVGKAMLDYTNLLRQQEATQFRLEELRKSMSPDDLAASVARRLGAERGQVAGLRTDLGTGIALGDAGIEQEARRKLGRNLRNQAGITSEITAPVLDALQSLTNLPFLGALKGGVKSAEKSQADLLAAALSLTTLKVIIKGVDE